MDYIELWNKRMKSKGGNSSEVVRNQSDNVYCRKFENDPSYKMAILTTSDMVEKPLKIRVVNIDKTTDEKRFNLLPRTRLKAGDYVRYDINQDYDDLEEEFYTYIIEEIEINQISPTAKAILCEMVINVSKELSFSCVAKGESYGVKLKSNHIFYSETDTKVKIILPNIPHITNIVDIGFRFILNNSKYGIYKVGDITVYKKGLLEITCEKDKYMEGLDDLENGIAHNEYYKPNNVYSIIGKDVIKINTPMVYAITPDTIVDFKISNSNCDLISHTENECIIKATKEDEVIEMICTDKDGNILAEKSIVTVKR